ncbi:dihydrofolate reductase family protein [Nocardia camponoti]|uniref:Deaminase reductase n=1 Tax=Nocardia camponoti TaxID=1616106 RepID=A0A917QRT2_9NOCA|nr:dihydrofolate reductase family protein [Nocardia camponoti]GGK64042.1 deaminase reductase [Nocardia camponoti]
MELSLTEFLTIDGVYQAPGGPDEDLTDGFTHGGWSATYGDDEFGEYIDAIYAKTDGFLLGRRTYDIFAGYWPKVTDPDNPVATKLNTLPKYVATETLTESDWAGTTFLNGDVVEEVKKLKAQPGGELQMHGSGDLAHTLLAAGVVDILHLAIFPVVVGTGKKLFTDTAMPTKFQLAESRTTSSGIILTTYRADGAPIYGTIED